MPLGVPRAEDCDSPNRSDMMRFPINLLLFLLLIAGCAGADEKAAPKAESAEQKSTPQKESVEFDGQKLFLASEGKNPGETVKEFVPEGDDLKSWTRLASIREYPESR